MTGLELLRKEMERRGATKSQINSKVVPMVLDILSETGQLYTTIKENEDHLQMLQSQVHNTQMHIQRQEKTREELAEEINELKREKGKYLTEERQYVHDWLEALKDIETAESRDLMRKAQVFVNSVDIETKYDNTAFIIGLASLLSGGEIGAINELKKINRKIPSVDIGDTIMI